MIRTKTLDLDGQAYRIREIPAGFLRLHPDMQTQAAQADLLGHCVLDDEGKPLGPAADDSIPLRHLEQLLTAIAELSGLVEGNAETAS